MKAEIEFCNGCVNLVGANGCKLAGRRKVWLEHQHMLAKAGVCFGRAMNVDADTAAKELAKIM